MIQRDIEVFDELRLSTMLSGTPVSRLPEKKIPGSHDLLLLTRNTNISTDEEPGLVLDEYHDGAILLEGGEGFLVNEESSPVILSADRKSLAIEYCDLCADVEKKSRDKIRIGSMAFQDKDAWAPAVHDHDDIYSKVAIRKPTLPDGDDFVRIATFHLSSFNEDGEVVYDRVDIDIPFSAVDNTESYDIGTLKFVGVDSINDEVVDYGGKYNVNIFSDDFDGWVFPNGTVFKVSPGEFQSAMQTYGSGDDTFTVPNLTTFISINPGFEKEDAMKFVQFSNGLPRHNHGGVNVNMTATTTTPKMVVGVGANPDNGYLCGFGNPSKPMGSINFSVSGTFDGASLDGLRSSTSDPSLDVEQRPTHNLMPVMVYIGRRLSTK